MFTHEDTIIENKLVGPQSSGHHPITTNHQNVGILKQACQIHNKSNLNKYCYRLNFKKANMLTLIIKKDYHNWPDILLSSIMVSTWKVNMVCVTYDSTKYPSHKVPSLPNINTVKLLLLLKYKHTFVRYAMHFQPMKCHYCISWRCNTSLS